MQNFRYDGKEVNFHHYVVFPDEEIKISMTSFIFVILWLTSLSLCLMTSIFLSMDLIILRKVLNLQVILHIYFNNIFLNFFNSLFITKNRHHHYDLTNSSFFLFRLIMIIRYNASITQYLLGAR